MKQTLKYIYSIVYDDMKFAEAKHNIVLTLSGAVIAFSTTFFSSNSIQTVFAVASIIFSLIAILYSFVALIARRVRVRQRKRVKNNPNLISYSDIIHFDEFSYIKAIKSDYDFVKQYKPDQMDYDLAREIISTSKLTWIKCLYFNLAVIFLIASILSIIIAVLIRGNLW